MASAGRILIMPKGAYDSSYAYEMLDLVFFDGASWIAKKNVTGIAPSDENSEYWQRMVAGTDLSEIEKRIGSLEDKEDESLDNLNLLNLEISGVDYIEQTFETKHPDTVKIFANVIGSTELFVVGVNIVSSTTESITVKFLLNKAYTGAVSLRIGYMC